MPHRSPLARAATAAGSALLAGALLAPVPASAATGPTPSACPAGVADVADCWTGQDDNGAYYAIAVPHDWNGDLVVHAHGGPDLGDASDPARSVEDLDRWAVMAREGYAWVGSAYRRGGYGTRMAVADTESARQVFEETFGVPGTTLAHGQSWGGDVAAKLVEVHPTSYDGVLLTNGVLAGASRGYDYRVDLRVVYQYYCGNHPRPTEPQYPLWMGLREDSTMTSAGLRSRLQECTGYQSAPADRTAAAAAQPRRHPRRHEGARAHPRVAPALRHLHLPRHRPPPARRPEPVQQRRRALLRQPRRQGAQQGRRAVLRRPGRQARPHLGQRPHRRRHRSRP